MPRTTHLCCALMLCLCAPAVSAQLGTAFTYQGQLNLSGAPADGLFDFQFALFDNAEGGDASAGPVDVPGVAVTAGHFTARIDLGAGAFETTDPWLEVRVRDAAAGGAYTTLSPRQQITPTPSALVARNAAPPDIQSVGDGQSGCLRIGAIQQCWGVVPGDLDDVSVDTVDFDRAFNGAPRVTLGPTTEGAGSSPNNGRMCKSRSITETTLGVKCYDASDNARDMNVHYFAVGAAGSGW